MASSVILRFRNGKYYAGDAGPVNYSPALAEYAPGDRVTVEGGAVTGLVERKARTTVGVVRGFHAGRVYFHCPLLGSIFNPSAVVASMASPIVAVSISDRHAGGAERIEQSSMTIGDRVLLRLGADKSVTVIRSYGPCHDRSADWQIIYDIYTAVEEITPHPVTWGKAYYTQPYRDQTSLPTFTIDPVGSLDADDAVTVDEASRTVYVHIVDAAGQLDAGSVVDINALRYAFTLYLAEGNHNILPKELAEDALSLVEGKPRRVITVEIRFAEEESRISGYDIYPATICVKKRYSYDDAPAMPFLEAIDAARKRHDFCIPQVAMDVRLDTGELAATRHVYNTDAAHRNIETLMVLANMLVSKHLQEQAAGTMAKIPQRFHTRLPGAAVAVPPATADAIVNSFLAIKSFAQASYQADASGHFGLGLTTYTHFTSPIRRYFDVIIHRILAGAEITDLEEQLAYINERERLVEELQRLYTTWKIVGRISAGDVWPAVTVTKVVPAGIYYLDTELMMDGFIHVSRLGDGASGSGRTHWEFVDGRLCGSGGRTVAVGDRVACRVDKVDHITGTMLMTALLP